MRPALIVAVLLAASVAHASPGQDLENARKYFRAKDCQSAMPLLSNLLYPSERLGEKDDLFDARAMLGACDVEIARTDDAKQEFRKALKLKPTEALDSMFYTRDAQRVFNETKHDLDEEARRDAEARHQQELRDALAAYKKSLRVYQANPYYLNFVPFGIGQFQNDHNLKGIWFATSETLTLGTSAVIWYYLVNKYGINCPTCVKSEDASTVRFLQQVEIGTGLAFMALYIWGAIDARLHYQPQKRIDADDSMLPQNLRDIDKQQKRPKKTSLKDRIHVGPMLTPSGAGIGIGWEN